MAPGGGRVIQRFSLRPLGLLAACAGLSAAPVWKAPPQLKLGELQVLELREDDPTKPAPPRPTVEERLGPLRVRAMEPLPDGRGWRFQVQALEPGLAVVPALDLGNGQRSPELRLQVPRTMPYGGPWVGIGGGNDDRLPAMPFPWTWACLPLLPPLIVLGWALRRWRKGTAKRRLRHAIQAFQRHWPPTRSDRETLDAAHRLGRDLLAESFGEAARAWGPMDFQSHHLHPWDQWAKSLDAARFGLTEPPFPRAEALVAALEIQRREGAPR
jgi:hypothetical protein